MSNESPLSFGEQLEMPVRYPEPQWWDRARERSPLREPVRAAGSIGLDHRVLEETARDAVFEEHDVEGGGDTGATPRPLVLPHPKPLRRWDGRKVIPFQFTQIWQSESRQLFFDTSAPWVRIGRIAGADGGWGSAALIGRSSVVTAAHVVRAYWSPDGPVANGVTFTPALNGTGSALGSGWVAGVVGIAAWAHYGGVEEAEGYDMAVCQLDQPFGEWLGFFGARSYDDDWEDEHHWTHVGYPWDMSPAGVRPCWEAGIAVHDDDGDDFDTLELETEADAASGQSGGPLWGRWSNGGRQIIGVMSGVEDNTAERKNTLFAGGRGLVSLVSWARANWG